MRKSIPVFLLILFIISACGPSPEEQAALTAASFTAAAASWTATPSHTPSPTTTFTPTITFTPAVTLTPTITATPTFAFPTVTVNKQAHCRYGTAVAYLHAADLYPGNVGSMRGRAVYSNWLYIKFDKLEYLCWVAPSVVDVVGDISNINKVTPNLLSIGSNQYGPPHNVRAVRDGDKVTISWDQMMMTDDKDRGYFIEAFVCQDGNYL